MYWMSNVNIMNWSYVQTDKIWYSLCWFRRSSFAGEQWHWHQNTDLEEYYANLIFFTLHVFCSRLLDIFFSVTSQQCFFLWSSYYAGYIDIVVGDLITMFVVCFWIMLFIHLCGLCTIRHFPKRTGFYPFLRI